MIRPRLALVLVVCLLGCPADPGTPGDTARVLTIANGAEPETLDLHRLTGVPETRLVNALFEGLVGLDPQTLAPVPGVAESWRVSEDGLRYVFKLRAGAEWSDGTPLTASDFVSSWRRALTPATACELAFMLFPIQGAEAFQRGQGSFAGVGVRAADARTLEVTLREPCAYFLQLLAFKTFFPIPIKIVNAHPERWATPGLLVCNGPFLLEAWRPREAIELVPNPRYWNAAVVELDRVVVFPHESQDTTYRMFQAGEVDWCPNAPTAKLAEIKRLPEYYAAPYLGSYFFRFNTTKPPFSDVRVRKAFSMAVDRQTITDDLIQGGQTPAAYLTPPMPGYAPPTGLDYDPEAAAKLLREAYPDLSKFPTVELLYNTSEDHKIVAEKMVQFWEENLGVAVALRNTEWKVFLDSVQRGNYQIARAAWSGDYLDPSTFLDLWVTDGGKNNTGWSSEAYDRLLVAATRERDPARRMALLRQAETILVERELPILPLFLYSNRGLLSESVSGLYHNPIGHYPLQFVRLNRSR